MSKKPQPQIKENQKNRLQIVQEQNEPFLKALQKKVRNINKKLQQISELENKENLKPQQIEKIGRKDNLIEERTKLEEFASMYKQTYSENAAYYRTIQLKELQTVARGIVAYHSEHPTEDRQKLNQFWSSLQSHSFSTVNEGIATLSNSLKDFASDRKLQKNLNSFVEKYGEVKGDLENQEKIVKEICDEKKEEPKTEPVVVSAPAPEKKEEKVEEAKPSVAHVVHEKVAEQPVQPPKPTEVKTEDPKTQPQTVEPKETEQTKTVQEKEQGKQRTDDRPYRGRGGYRGNNRDSRGFNNGEKKAYKPKYQEKEREREEERYEKKDTRKAEESSDSSPQTRNFRRDQIRKLQDEGFIVVGKPKPKAKNQKEQREFYQSQHGAKRHYHHQVPATSS